VLKNAPKSDLPYLTHEINQRKSRRSRAVSAASISDTASAFERRVAPSDLEDNDDENFNNLLADLVKEKRG
jgi:hypothetical protein